MGLLVNSSGHLPLMFTPRKNRNLRKKIDVDDEESAEAPDVSSTIGTVP